MGDRLVLWSGSGRYVASKDVASAAINGSTGVVLVDWGGGDAQLLAGGSWDILTAREGDLCCQFVRSDNLTNNTNRFPLPKVQVKEPVAIDLIEFAGASKGGAGNDYNPSNCSQSFPNQTWRSRTFVTWTDANGQSARSEIYVSSLPNVQVLSLQLFVDDCFVSRTIKTVTTDAEQSSSRNTATDPTVSLLGDGCAIAVTFTDDTTLDIPLGYCPDWVKVMPANSCPPDTCHECVHDDQKCCYSLANDNTLKLIDRFHLTS